MIQNKQLKLVSFFESVLGAVAATDAEVDITAVAVTSCLVFLPWMARNSCCLSAIDIADVVGFFLQAVLAVVNTVVSTAVALISKAIVFVLEAAVVDVVVAAAVVVVTHVRQKQCLWSRRKGEDYFPLSNFFVAAANLPSQFFFLPSPIIMSHSAAFKDMRVRLGNRDESFCRYFNSPNSIKVLDLF